MFVSAAAKISVAKPTSPHPVINVIVGSTSAGSPKKLIGRVPSSDCSHTFTIPLKGCKIQRQSTVTTTGAMITGVKMIARYSVERRPRWL
jgi:hypothetical protein